MRVLKEMYGRDTWIEDLVKIIVFVSEVLMRKKKSIFWGLSVRLDPFETIQMFSCLRPAHDQTLGADGRQSISFLTIRTVAR
jgi:hypothetical protein